jgi:hypothetical protein
MTCYDVVEPIIVAIAICAYAGQSDPLAPLYGNYDTAMIPL